MKYIIIVFIFFISFLHNDKVNGEIIKSYKIRGQISKEEEKTVISLLATKHQLTSIIELRRLDTNFIEVLVRVNDEDRISYEIVMKDKEWRIIHHSRYKMIKGFAVIGEINRDDVEQIIDVLKQKKSTLPYWEIVISKDGVVKANNFDDDEEEAFGATYTLAKIGKFWRVIAKTNWES